MSSGLVPYPAANGELTVEFAINPARFHEIFAADLPAEEAAVMATIQRPIAELAFSDPADQLPGGACPHGPSSPPVTSIGERARPISSPPIGRNAAPGSCR